MIADITVCGNLKKLATFQKEKYVIKRKNCKHVHPSLYIGKQKIVFGLFSGNKPLDVNKNICTILINGRKHEYHGREHGLIM
jgi:hypothetical protein